MEEILDQVEDLEVLERVRNSHRQKIQKLNFLNPQKFREFKQSHPHIQIIASNSRF